MWGLAVHGPLARLLNHHVPSFRLEDHRRGGFVPVPSMSGGLQMGIGDYNGDGRPDVAHFNRVGLMAREFTENRTRVMWAHNYDPDFSIPFRSRPEPHEIASYRFLVGPGHDVTGDGCDESFATFCSHSGDRWIFEMVDGVSGSCLLKVELPIGEDLRPDGHWDGEYQFQGVIEVPADDDRTRRLAILSLVVQYDRMGRGILALDLESGREAWFYPLANNPLPSEVFLVDLDGDGLREVAILAGAAGNFQEDETVGELKDDHVRVFVIAADGRLRWMRDVTETWGSSGRMTTQDLDGDGRPELVVGTNSALPGNLDHAYVFNGQGDLLARRVLPGRTQEICSLPMPGDPIQIYLFTHGQELLGFALADTGLVLHSRDRIPAVDRVLGPLVLVGRSEYLLTTDRQDLHLFHPREGWLKVALDLDGPLRDLHILPQPEGEVVLVVLTDTWQFLNLTPVLYHSAATATLVALPVLVAMVPPGWYLRRRRRRSGIVGPAREEIKQEIARRLKRDRHCRIGPVHSLEQLLMLLQWAETQGVDPDAGPGLRKRLRDRCEILVTTDLPSVLESGELAESIGLGSGIMPRLRKCHEELTRLLNATLEQPDLLTGLEEGAAQLRAAHRDMKVDLEHLSDEFATYEGVDLWAEIQEAVKDHAATFAEAGVQVSQGPPPADDVRIILPRQDLRHLLDNLVRNACRAMEGSAPRLFQIQVRTSGNRVQCEFADTGPGIDPALRERLFQEPVSSSGGTGEGLYDSARIVSRYDGKLEALAPENEEGACLRLTLPFL